MNQHIVVEPRHGFFAKDGRGWYTGGGGQGSSLPWLYPTTLRGALCTSIGRLQEESGHPDLNPADWLSLKSSFEILRALAYRAPLGTEPRLQDRMWPAPMDAVFPDEQGIAVALRARPSSVTLLDDAPGGLELLGLPSEFQSNAKLARGPVWWTESEFVAWLSNAWSDSPRASQSRTRQPLSRSDVHVKMDPNTGAAEAGYLWSTVVRETLTPGDGGSGSQELHRWGFAMTVRSKSGQALGVPEYSCLGGERQLADVKASSDLGVFPPALSSYLLGSPASLRIRVYAVTPTVFSNGWMPDGFVLQHGQVTGRMPGLDRELRMVTAAVSRPLSISGWEMAATQSNSTATGTTPKRRESAGGAPKSTMLACPPGSMWLFEALDGTAFSADELERLWLCSWGQGREDGLGLMVAAPY